MSNTRFDALGHVIARCLGLALMAMPLVSHAGTRTITLFNEAMETVPQPQNGAKLYQRHCIECHGGNAFGDIGKSIPSLASQIEPYVVKQLVDFAELDREAPEMHRLMARPELGTPQAWRDVAAYVESLPPNPRPQAGRGDDVEYGARSYKAYCTTCHGEAGEGLREAPVPALRGQHYSYLLLQLQSFDADRRKNVAGALVEHMVGLSRKMMEAIADYLSRLPNLPREETVMTRDVRPPARRSRAHEKTS
jgi:cytochrome c553